MNLSRKKDSVDFIESVTRRSSILQMPDKRQGLDFLVSFFSSVRPGRGKSGKDPVLNMDRALNQMNNHPILVSHLRRAVFSLLVKTDFSPALTESGMSLAGGFWQEFFGRMRHKILPKLQKEDDFLHSINRIFFLDSDYEWVEKIPHDHWTRFFEMLGLSFQVDGKNLGTQLLYSLKVLSFQVARFGLEKEVLDHLPEDRKADNPFVDQNHLVQTIERLWEKTDTEPRIRDTCFRLKEIIRECQSAINYIRKHHSEQGTSLEQTYILVILDQKLDRMNLVVDVIDTDHQFNTAHFVSFFKTLVRNENRKNSLREFASRNMGYLAYQIAEHKGSKGSSYITSTRKEYNRMIWSAMKGGFIISFIAFIKNWLTKLEMPIFWHGLLYSSNYSAGFVLIDSTHSTLATKQPAFTASAVAVSLDTRQNTLKPNLYNLAVTVAKVSRSQFASFFGNLLIVFPGAFLLAWFYHFVTGSPLLTQPEAMTAMETQHPWHSLSLLYACNTGFFLFLSGIIAGYVQNKIRYAHVGERLKDHPLWLTTATPEKLERRSMYIEKNAGMICGNIALGFFLGMSSVVGKLTGIPFDIRHITVSAGNVGIAVYTLGYRNVPWQYLLTVFLGVLGIGFFNFLSSFLFAFLVAVRSRGVKLKEYPEFLGILWRYFWKKPLAFIRPPAHATESE